MNKIWQNNTEIKLLKQKHDSENNTWWEIQKFKAELYLKNKEMDNSEIAKPPLGLIPKKYYDAQKTASRFNDVCRAIVRYYNAGLPINIEGVEEYNEILKLIKDE